MVARVAVTGIGVVSSIGSGFEDYSRALMRGTSGAGPVTVIDGSRFRNEVACEVADFERGSWFQRTPAESVGRAAAFAVAASRMAVRDAFGDEESLADRRGAVMLGTSDGGSHEIDHLVAAYSAGEPVDADVARRVPHDGISRSVVDELGLSRTEAVVNGNACAASNQAIGLAFDAVASGDVEFAITGGADALCRRGFAAFSRLNLMAPDVSRPFDEDREGLLIGEGAAVLLLEDLDRAIARGATVYAEVLGYGATCDRHNPVQPLVEGVAECIRVALDRADVSPEDVDMVSAHGTGTPTNDVTESRALNDALGTPPPVTAVKSMLGHSMGAAGAMGALACIAALREQRIPPTINHVNKDARCEVDVVAGESRAASISVAQNNALGFFGNNAVVLFGRHDRSRADVPVG